MLNLSKLYQIDKSMTGFAPSLKIQVNDDHNVCKVVRNLSETHQKLDSKYTKRFCNIVIYTNKKGIIKTKKRRIDLSPLLILLPSSPINYIELH